MNRFYIQHGHGTDGPFMTESVQAREDWKPQKKRAGATACRFLVQYRGKWRRLYAEQNTRAPLPHFITCDGQRLRISGVAP